MQQTYLYVTKINKLMKMCNEYVGEFERITIDIGKYDKEKQKKLYKLLKEMGINFSYEYY